MEGLLEMPSLDGLPVPLHLSRIVKDIQRKNVTCLQQNNTVYEAVAWMRDVAAGLVPVMTGDPAKRSIASLQTIAAETVLQALLYRLQDTACTLGAFFSTPLADFQCCRVPIVCPRMGLRDMVYRMVRRQSDLLLAFDGVNFTGLVTAGDIFDAVIGTAIIDEAFFKMDTSQPGEILEGIRICCSKYRVAGIADRRLLRHLNPANTLLTAIRALCRQPASGLLATDSLRKMHRLLTARDLLIMLLNHFECSLSTESLSAELMRPLETLADMAPPVVAPANTVLEAVQTIHFNNLTGAVILSDRDRHEGVVTIQALLKAFLGSMHRTSSMTFSSSFI